MSAATILIADDDQSIRTVLSHALGRLGHEVRTTGTAANLWRWISNGEGDLVITDVVMPDENGLDITDYNSYGLHYSSTLKIWRYEFMKKWEDISKQGFDLNFKRMWNFYLSYCEAGFKSKNIDLIQFALQK